MTAAPQRFLVYQHELGSASFEEVAQMCENDRGLLLEQFPYHVTLHIRADDDIFTRLDEAVQMRREWLESLTGDNTNTTCSIGYIMGLRVIRLFRDDTNNFAWRYAFKHAADAVEFKLRFG